MPQFDQADSILVYHLIYPLAVAWTYLVTSWRFFTPLFIDGARLKSGRGGPAKRASEFVNDFSSDRLIPLFTAICQRTEKDACTRLWCVFFIAFLGFYADLLTCESVLASVEFINLRCTRFWVLSPIWCSFVSCHS